MRSLVFIFTIAVAYLLLRGFPGEWHIILRVSLAGFGLLIGLIFWGKRPSISSSMAQPARPPRWLNFFSAGLAILVIEAAFLLFFASAPEVTEDLARKLDAQLHPASSRVANASSGDSAASTGPLETSGNWLWNQSGFRALGGSRKARPSNKPEVYLWPDDGRLFQKNKLYLRSFTLSQYEAGVWAPLPQAPQSFLAKNGRINLASSSRSLAYEIYHGPNARGQSFAITLQNLTEIETPSLRKIAPATYRLPPLKNEESAYRYRARSAPKFFTADLLPALGASLLPMENEIIRELAAATSGSPGQRLLQIRDLLSQQYRYSLDPQLAEGKDPLREFLVTKKRGYCEHFATAAALLAREVGYPSRIAYGWSGGRYYEASNMFVFRAKEAHAWAEVQVESGEWVIFEATPPSRAEGSPSTAQENERPPLPQDLEKEFAGSAISLPSLAPLKRVARTVGLLALFVWAILLFVKRPRKKGDSQEHAAQFLLPRSLNYFIAFRRASSALGFPMPLGRTLRQHLESLHAQGQAPDFSDELLSYHYRVTYENEPRIKKTERRLLASLKKWRQSAK